MKLQWIRTNKKQKVGSQEEILPITAEIFRNYMQRDIHGEPPFARWKAEHPAVTHVLFFRNEETGDRTFMDAGPLEALMPSRSERRFIIVDSWDEPRAVRWARLTKPPVKQDWSSRDEA